MNGEVAAVETWGPYVIPSPHKNHTDRHERSE